MYQDSIEKLFKIYKNNKVEVENDSDELEKIVKLSIKIDIVEFAFRELMEKIEKAEEEIRESANVDEVPLHIMITILFLYESYLLQLRICMDFWAKFFHHIPNYKMMGHSFEKHKNKIDRIIDQEYQKYINEMSWFEELRDTRNDIKSGKVRIFKFSAKLDGLIILGLGKKFNNTPKPARLLKDFCNELQDNFEKYCDYVENHFSKNKIKKT